MTRTEKRRISETMDSIMMPLIQHLDEQTKEVVRQALRILRDDEVVKVESSSGNPSDWIPVSERLPKVGQRVLITYNHEDELKVDITYFFSAYEDKYGFLLATPIAWMPLPKPYMEESEREE